MYLTLAIIVGLVVVIYVGIYNGLVRSRQKANEAWSGIDVQLKRRHDLIPRLINVVKAYAAHERTLLEEITKLRAEALLINSEKAEALGKTEHSLELGLHSLFAVAERYPQLKANENYLKLQQELSETEDQIAASRNIYNSNVAAFNSKVESFPNVLVAAVQGFKKMEFFEKE